MSSKRPAILGGAPALIDPVPLTRPTQTVNTALLSTFSDIVKSGNLTKGDELAALERAVCEFLGVQNAIAVSSCTSGLMLTLCCLGLRGEIVLPSFTFMATGHAALWNGLTPVFADIDPDTFAVDPDRVAEALTPRTAAVFGAHTFGAPCDVGALAKLAAEGAVPLVLDAAPAFGGTYPGGAMIGTGGTVEVFSLSPTKPFTTGEGGIIATDDAALARELRIGREYGNAGGYDSAFAGLNARMPELSAALGRHNLPHLPELLERRGHLADRYRAGLADLAGVRFQRFDPSARPTYKDVGLRVSPEEFGIDRDTLASALRAEHIATRNYYDPPLHRQKAYRRFDTGSWSLPHTEELSRTAITVPLWSDMPEHLVDQICDVIRVIHEHAPEIADRIHLNEALA
ncbi:DegT/DnrJ/EryC1/StrS family aminotransferase [Catenulispora sp. NF23]|uniref:DegT/DnrJ/EryC1/StrS family aminotransferase n=1 Tax=Catenulispora pinistramenti TaxID=2705254 RepID=UPI001BAAFED9|nr:DegT/DnrJ/EryC1/StrS family aminotransferase [Catenulispora pinistramenti]MBS2532709.1 DegT/DnrJ/EryC1/StrS family aminotransferase [Catenulispora pinistramenti]